MSHSPPWPRIIAHVDMDCFFAAVEQRDFPELRGQPVAVTNGINGSCIITRSYEARRYGVKTGMRLPEALNLCPDLIRMPSRPYVYAKISSDIMQALECMTPDIEIFSVDEAFLDFSHCRRLYKTPKEIVLKIKNLVYELTDLTCSVGLSGDKSTAKIGSKYNKPNGYKIIPPWQAREFLSDMPVTQLCGVAKGIGSFLAQYDVFKCGDMQNIPMSVLAKRFGNIGRRIWFMAQGDDPEPLHTEIAAPKSMGHGKIMPPNTCDESTILVYFDHMAEKVARRLRKHDMAAQTFFIGFRINDGWLSTKVKTATPTHDGHAIFLLAKSLLHNKWQGEGLFQCQITALDPQPADMQIDLLTSIDDKTEKINHVLDDINDRFGQGSLSNGITMQSLHMPEVISPAWRPDGIRATITSTSEPYMDSAV